jgi:hypothetical protein
MFFGVKVFPGIAGRVLAVGVLLMFAPSMLCAQDGGDPTALLRVAVQKLTEAKQSKTRFTYLDASRTVNFNEKGQPTADVNQVFEVTYIADLQYARLVEEDGRPLTGNELEAEQKRYDKAVRERAELDEKARAKMQHQMFKDTGLDVASLLTGYRNTALGREMVGDVDCVVIDSTPLSDAEHKHYREWVDAGEGRMMRLRFDQLADDGDMLAGGTGVLLWTYLEGTPLMSEIHLDVKTKDGKKRVRIVVHHVYSRFRKFSVSTTILPVAPDGVPDRF